MAMLVAGFVLIVATLVVLVLRDDSSESVNATSNEVPTALPDEVLVRVANMVRTNSNEGGPEEVPIRYVEGPASAVYTAMHMSRPVQDAESRVFAVVAEGDFTMRDASIPPGADLPTGRYLVVLFSAADSTMAEGTSWGTCRPTCQTSAPSGRRPSRRPSPPA